ncbi:DoxX family protein [Flagellimonas sp. HMM57]|uniref:DoxX family protein n=1 Tax=unclassified Flagellimonas TaxID=2644544 RepID=UPI0013D1691D|nr:MULTISPECIES: DoxX family protein [unclassified Flagellimonas]UII77617.1 DoxX family protein [Flagellimonas sp. HMM57]
MDNIFNYPVQILLFLFLAITFLQSGVDKVLDWKSNLSWLTGHFSKTFLKNSVPLLLGIILLLELVSGTLSVVGMVQFIASGESVIGFYGAMLSAITLLMLLFGQRVAKDYEGAKTIVIYFVPTIFLVYLLHQ